jgi:hypothetical protein
VGKGLRNAYGIDLPKELYTPPRHFTRSVINSFVNKRTDRKRTEGLLGGIARFANNT